MKVKAIVYKCCKKVLASYPLDKINYKAAESFRLLCFDYKLHYPNEFDIKEMEHNTCDYSQCTCP